MRIRIQQFFLNADMREKYFFLATKFKEKKSWRVFSSCKKHKRLRKSKNQWSLYKFTLKKLNKVAVFSNLLAFFQFSVDKFTLLDPDPCGSRSTALEYCYQKDFYKNTTRRLVFIWITSHTVGFILVMRPVQSYGSYRSVAPQIRTRMKVNTDKQ